MSPDETSNNPQVWKYRQRRIGKAWHVKVLPNERISLKAPVEFRVFLHFLNRSSKMSERVDV